jgi:pimeloyl-ACP methyl ester carboxylesterase
MAENLRFYGKAPFTIAVVHGGPGAAGEMAPVAEELANDWGVLEPLQTAMSVDGQIEELKTVLETNGNGPAILVGFSWGAWLTYLLAAKYPELVKKLILVGSGGFEEKYVANLHETRMSRLTEAERAEVGSLMAVINDPAVKDKNAAFARFGALFSKTDTFDPLPGDGTKINGTKVNCRADIYNNVWPEAAELRRSGKLLELGRQIHCPTIAIHGDYDPTPAEAVEKPLSALLTDFRFLILPHCGHKPWIERQAKAKFYDILKAELN